jgi:hypothetical protein
MFYWFVLAGWLGRCLPLVLAPLVVIHSLFILDPLRTNPRDCCGFLQLSKLFLYPPLAISSCSSEFCLLSATIAQSVSHCFLVFLSVIRVSCSGNPTHQSLVCLLKLLLREVFRWHLWTFICCFLLFYSCLIAYYTLTRVKPASLKLAD